MAGGSKNIAATEADDNLSNHFSKAVIVEAETSNQFGKAIVKAGTPTNAIILQNQVESSSEDSSQRRRTNNHIGESEGIVPTVSSTPKLEARQKIVVQICVKRAGLEDPIHPHHHHHY